MNTPTPTELLFSDGEQIVRTYQCTQVRQWFRKPVSGFITVTNKRVIYHAEEKTSREDSAVISEMPIEDVAGISSSISSQKSWIWIPLIFAALYVVNNILGDVLPDFLTHWAVAIMLMVPYLIHLLFEKNILNQNISEQIQRNLDESNAGGVGRALSSPTATFIYRILFFAGLNLLAWYIGTRTELGYSIPLAYFVLLFGVAFWIFKTYFGRQLSFNLAISSKTAKGGGIQISGDLLSLFGAAFSAAAKSMNSTTGDDAPTLIKELGAMILDIQQMGDLGIQKWMVK